MGLNIPIVHIIPGFVPEAEVVFTGQSSKEPYFLFVGRLEKLKGLQTLIPIFRRYRNAHLLIAGNSPVLARIRGV